MLPTCEEESDLGVQFQRFQCALWQGDCYDGAALAIVRLRSQPSVLCSLYNSYAANAPATSGSINCWVQKQNRKETD